MITPAKLYMRAELKQAVRESLAAYTESPGPLILIHPENVDMLAYHMYDQYGSDVNVCIDEPRHTEPGLCARCGDYDPKLTEGLCPVCIETGGR